jgi:hypothetical protein
MYGLSGKVYSSASVMALICTALALPALDQRSGASALAGQVAAPVPLVWDIDPTCTKADPTDKTRRCTFKKTQVIIGQSKDPYDHFHFGGCSGSCI